ncbi:LOW QUALITY PROTEIN: hypothetical protein TorRG33x02_180700 [Trema orientale]|uniref:Uncharacterized protein n=1 Tax=Trema orientale TaxID=63057 RepID=A0A2P5EKV8_TREOI|nr:LOW QUALITY PROTEIN: hypothetical protein TorRG33x02_180700 [Trema orientale]
MLRASPLSIAVNHIFETPQLHCHKIFNNITHRHTQITNTCMVYFIQIYCTIYFWREYLRVIKIDTCMEYLIYINLYLSLRHLCIHINQIGNNIIS